MFGPHELKSERINQSINKDMGIIPRAVTEIFEAIERKDLLQYFITCSFVQIYNENLYDMLR